MAAPSSPTSSDERTGTSSSRLPRSLVSRITDISEESGRTTSRDNVAQMPTSAAAPKTTVTAEIQRTRLPTR
jgi:hypothetical protein